MARAKSKFSGSSEGSSTVPATPPSKTAKRNAKEKSDIRARRKAEREQREAARREKAEQKEQEEDQQREQEISEGKVILTEDGEEFHLVQRNEDSSYEIDDRAAMVITNLKKANGTPLLGRELQEELGGGYPLYIPIFSTLKALGYVTEYRRRTGERGGGGKAYLWTGPRE